jgi:hypothetical protein
LRCDECGAVAAGKAPGWVAVLLDLDDDPELPDVAIFCPACVAREFNGTAAFRPDARFASPS